MNKLNIREIINQSIDFFKMHYEYLLPFSLSYIVFNLPSSFIKSVWTLPLTILIMPLAFSIPYFADRIERHQEKKFSLLFEIYHYALKYFAFTILRGIILMILLAPFIYSVWDIVGSYDFDMEKFNEAIKVQAVDFSSESKVMMAISFILVLFSMPFILFAEYFGILDGHSILKSFALSFSAGKNHYVSIVLILIISMMLLFGGLISCCIGLVFALPLMYLIYYFTYRAICPISEA
jgi:uncharacterized membrane protein